MENMLQQLMDEMKDIKVNMATKEDINYVKKDIEQLDGSVNYIQGDIKQIKGNIKQLEEKIDQNAEGIDRNFSQVALNSEKLHCLYKSSERQDKSLETLALRSIEHETKLRNL
ncbi:hypothetical protein [Lentibacillus juripiscarius]|uniref:t-SNARE coiled-coil homology domain-containing protein n=1 Tax=Lentibacillus juripiscarius TaxID=257446 RepID=A0ABW5V2R3_9BACI